MKARGIFGSIEARGKFGDLMVAFPWKDLQVIRVLKYPAQPRTPLQKAIRLQLSNAVAEMKAALYTEVDRRAQVLLASLRPKGETGPNQIVRELIRVARATFTWSRLRDGQDTFTATGDRRLQITGDAALENVNVAYGSNIRYMHNVGVCIWLVPDLIWYFIIPTGTFTAGTKVFFQFYDSAGTVDDALGVTGIYSYVQE